MSWNGSILQKLFNEGAKKTLVNAVNNNPNSRPITELKTSDGKQAFKTQEQTTEEEINKIISEEETPTEEEISGNTSQSEYEQLQNKIWEREDAIRKETQEREDTAYQRAVEDMRKAGINPNLVGINPANSGGGITTATNVMGTASDKINGLINLKIAELQNQVKQGTATEGNITNIIGDIISLVGQLYVGSKIGLK